MVKQLLTLTGFLFSIMFYAQTGIGTTTPHASAKLEVNATNKGFLPPRVTLTSNTDATTIPNPAEGLLVYNNGNNLGLVAGYYYWNGANWATIATAIAAGYGVAASEMQKIYDGVGNATTINSAGVTFTVPTSGTYLFDFSCSGTAQGGGTLTMNFYVRDGSTVLKSDMQTSYSNNAHAEYNGKIEVNLVVGKTYNVLVNTSSGGIYSSDYCRVYMKQMSGNLPINQHMASRNFQLNNNYLSNDGDNEGIRVDNSGKVGIGTDTPTSRLNIAGGGVRLATGFSNATNRPSVTTSTIGNYEIRAVGSGGSGTTQNDGADDGFLRLSAGGGTNASAQSSIDLSGFSNVSDMSNNIVMRTEGTERLRIINSGKIGIGTSTPGTSLHIQNGNTFGTDPSSTNSPSLYIFNSNNSSSSAHASAMIRVAGSGGGKPYLGLDVNGVSGYSIGVNNPTDQLILNTNWGFATGTASNNALIVNRSGQARVIIPDANGAYSGSFPSGWGGGFATYDISCSGIYYGTLSQRSDSRLKNSINDFGIDVMEKYLKLRPVSYYWNEGQTSDTKLQYGLIAQEVEQLFPEMVSTANDEIQTKSVNYQALHALSLKVIQSQQTEIEDLKKKQAETEQRLLQLEAKLNR